ncbi:AI-2E family transporter [Schaalia hyovaginalis]|uniref:AI-2E family transporter n=1 Tax=Schaalia hyovaginalis TaxID=29316 RepID=UPI0026F16A28|nr:AI-2E family transporter [Schaalia hyovaginalis]MCI7512761.1 AI-2E family transporter [Schaalia hyovaginalis]
MSDDSTRMKWRFAEIFERLATQVTDKPADSADDPMEFRPGDPLDEDRDAANSVPWSLRVAAALSWRAMVVAAAAAGIIWGAMRLSVIVMPVAIALLLAVLLEPLVGWLTRRCRFPRTLSAALGLLVMIAVVVVALSQAGNEIFQQLPGLFTKASAGVNELMKWIEKGPLKLDMTVVNQALSSIQAEITQWAQANSSTLATSALSVTSSVVSILSSTLIMLFCLFFFLKEGRTIWLWVVRLFPAPARRPLHESAIRGWVTLGSYVRTQIQVAAIDAVGIGLGAFFLGLPMVLPIIVVVFFASFVPIVGALLSGAIAVLVALVDQGVTAGVIMLVVILAVQQLESNILQPFLMSHAVSLHPMAVLLVVAAAGSVAGIPGAVFGVPVAAFVNATFLYLHGYDPMPELAADHSRPGGPPEMLDDLVAASFAGKTGADAAIEGAVPDAQGQEAPIGAECAAAADAAPSGESGAPGDGAECAQEGSGSREA